MKFQLDGVEYRIGFRHDPPRQWDAHKGHPVNLVDVNYQCRQGETRLYCAKCQCYLAGIAPRVEKKLRVTRGLGPRAILADLRLANQEMARNVDCTIWQRVVTPTSEGWNPLYTGTARLNTDAGDRYEREIGRQRALRSALPEHGWIGESNDAWRQRFNEAAWGAYANRQRKQRGAA